MPIFVLFVSDGVSFDGAFSMWVSLNNTWSFSRSFRHTFSSENKIYNWKESSLTKHYRIRNKHLTVFFKFLTFSFNKAALLYLLRYCLTFRIWTIIWLYHYEANFKLSFKNNFITMTSVFTCKFATTQPPCNSL